MSREEQELAGFTGDESNGELLRFPTPYDEHTVEERSLEDEDTIRVLEAQSTSELRKVAAYFVLSVYVAAVVLTFLLIALHGARIIVLPESLLSWLGPTMLTEVVSAVWMIIRHLFPVSDDS